MFDLKHNAENTIYVELLSSADGVTALTGAEPTVTLLKHGRADYGPMVGGAYEIGSSGTYAVVFDAEDCDTLGLGKVKVSAAGAITQTYDVRVLPAEVYEAIMVGSIKLPVDVWMIGGGDQLSGVPLFDWFDWYLIDTIVSSLASLPASTAAAVWAAGTRTLTSFGTLAADVAAAVWSATTRTLTSLAGLIGYQPRIVSPVLSDYSIEIVSGDDYTGDSAIAMPRAAWTGEDLTGATAEFRYMPAADHAAGTGTWAAIGTVSITPGAGGVDASVELTGAESGSLNTSPPASKYHYVYQLVVTRDGREHTLWEGKLTVKL
jgi:hypothetical protein